jgi:hypothetical protein
MKTLLSIILCLCALASEAQNVIDNLTNKTVTTGTAASTNGYQINGSWGSAGQVLTSTGSASAWSNAPSGGGGTTNFGAYSAYTGIVSNVLTVNQLAFTNNNGGSTSIITNSGAGSGSSASFFGTSDDTVQQILFTPGTISGPAQLMTITFNSAKSPVPRTVILQSLGPQASVLSHGVYTMYGTNFTATNYQIWCGATVPTSGGAYYFSATLF